MTTEESTLRVPGFVPGNIIELLPTAVYMCDPDGAITYFNRRAAELWGREPAPGDRFCGSLRLYRLDGSLLPHAETPMARAVGWGVPARNQEATIERADGSRVHVLINIDPMLDAEGALIGAVSTFQDIAEHPPAGAGDPSRAFASETIPGETGRHYREVLDALGVSVYTTDPQGYILTYNEAATVQWGRHPEIGKDRWCGSWRLFWPDGTPMAHDESQMAVALKMGVPTRGGEAVTERPDGTRVPFIAYPTPFLDASGRVMGAVNVLVDITERKAIETALNEALSAKDEFIGLVSHELRTPLTTILGNASILARRDNALSEDARLAATKDVHQEAIRLNRIVEDMLALARLDRGAIEYEPMSLTRVVEHIVREYRGKTEREIELSTDARLPIVNGEESLVSQVVSNYLSNAEKYSPPGSTIEVVVDATDVEARVRVLDRGIGIDPEEAELLFGSFYRSKDAAAIGGVGIGLSVCRHLIEAIGGMCWAAPRDGGGSEFGFSLPTHAS